MNAEVKMTKFMPFYLAIQGTILVTTFLDFPVYVMENHVAHHMVVTPWAFAWLVMVITGLVLGVSALLHKALLGAEQRKIAGGYLLGALAGFITLGIRFLPIMPHEYFYSVGLLTLLLAAAFVIIRLRQSRPEELFP